MARYYGVVGYGIAKEVPDGSGVWVDEIFTQHYRGDVEKQIRRMDSSEKLNMDIKVNNSISILADAFAWENFMYIKYVGWSGELWTVSSVEVRRPRLILHLGSVYNGPTS